VVEVCRRLGGNYCAYFLFQNGGQATAKRIILFAAYFLLDACIILFSTPKMKAVRSSETFSNFFLPSSRRYTSR
jgi:hypothetical protein